MTRSPYALADTDHGDLFGVFLAVHALPGSVLLLHTTVGCKFKTQLHLYGHDAFRESHNRRLWTGVDEVRLIAGSGERLIRFATTWYERRRPDLFVVTTNAAVELSAVDVEAAVEDLRRRLPCPVLLLPAPGYQGSLWGGYSRMVSAVAGLADWTAPRDPAAVGLAGYPFDRYEMDHVANLGEVRRLLKAVGLDLAGTLFSGEPLAAVRGIARAGTLIALPYAAPAVPALAAASGRPVATLDLPVGLAGSAAFLRAASAAAATPTATAAGLPDARTEAAIDRELARAAPLAARVADRVAGLRAAVCLDTPLAAAVTAFLLDLGLEVPLACLTDGVQANPAAFHATLDRLGAPPAGRPAVLAAPSRDEARDALLAEAARSPIPVIVGSAVQAGYGVPGAAVVQLGYPATGKHQVYPVPWMGSNGAVALAQRVMDAAAGAF
ncbi:MAG: hypothetical protein FJ087_07730 [Deltaproteobacteria bacterium]|nr:hypothetical protein [Deltaproteobacteria bacterium]